MYQPSFETKILRIYGKLNELGRFFQPYLKDITLKFLILMTFFSDFCFLGQIAFSNVGGNITLKLVAIFQWFIYHFEGQGSKQFLKN